MSKPKIGFTVICHPQEVGAKEAPKLLSKYDEILRNTGLEVVRADEPLQDAKTVVKTGKEFRNNQVDVMCVLVATWSSDELILDLLEEWNVPIILWGLPGIHTGSLCGAQQINCVLREVSKPCKFVYDDSEAALNEILVYSKAAALVKKLRIAKLGLIGYRVEGMTETAFDEFELKATIGPRVVHWDLSKLEDKIEKVADSKAQNLWGDIKKKAGKVHVSEQDGLYSVKAYFALKDFIKEYSLSGVTVKCVYDFMGRVCLAFSLLGDEGIVGSCEGDVNGLAAMLMLYELTQTPIHSTDILAVYEEDHSSVYSHCGSGAFSLAEKMEDITLEPVRLANEGLCVLFPGRPGKVTLVNLVGRRGTYRMCVIKAEAIRTEMVFPGNPVKVRLPVSIDQFLEIVSKEGIGHHWMIGYGDVSRELIQLGQLLGIKVILILDEKV